MMFSRIQALRSRTQRSPSLCEAPNGSSRPPALSRRSYSSLNLNPPTGASSKAAAASSSASVKIASSAGSKGFAQKEVKILGLSAPFFQFSLIIVIAVFSSVIIYYAPKRSNEDDFKISDPKRKAAAKSATGWRSAPEETKWNHLLSTRCTIDSKDVDRLTMEDFEQNYKYKKPVIINFPQGTADWIDGNNWNRESLVKQYGGEKVKIARSEEHAQFLGVDGTGNNDVKYIHMSLADFLLKYLDVDMDAEPMSVLETENLPSKDTLQNLKLPEFFGNKDDYDSGTFQLGGRGSGTGFHRSTDKWLGVVHGEVRVALYPPHPSSTSAVGTGDHSALSWFTHVYPHLPDSAKPTECHLKKGQILYVPEGSYHSHVSLADSVTFSWKRKHPSTSSMELVYQAHQASPDGDTDDEKEKSRRVHIYQQLTTAQPHNVDVWLDTADVYLGMGQRNEAFKMVEQATRLDGSTTRGQLMMANMFKQIGNSRDAELRYQVILKHDPYNWRAYQDYTHFLEKYKRPKEASKMLEKAVLLQPYESILWRRLLASLQKSGASRNKIAMVKSHVMKHGLA